MFFTPASIFACLWEVDPNFKIQNSISLSHNSNFGLPLWLILSLCVHRAFIFDYLYLESPLTQRLHMLHLSEVTGYAIEQKEFVYPVLAELNTKHQEL